MTKVKTKPPRCTRCDEEIAEGEAVVQAWRLRTGERRELRFCSGVCRERYRLAAEALAGAAA